MFTNSSHANGASQKPVDGLIRQVAQAADSFHNSHDEADRLAALQAAQKLVEAFQKPQDAVYNLAYSVISFRKINEHERLTRTSPHM